MVPRVAPALICLALATAPGLAAAQGIELSGTAEMGLMGGSQPAGGTRTRLLTDLELQIRMSTVTDGGLTIGVEFDLDDLLDETPAASPARRLPPAADAP